VTRQNDKMQKCKQFSHETKNFNTIFELISDKNFTFATSLKLRQTAESFEHLPKNEGTFSVLKLFRRQDFFSMYECVKTQRKMACFCTHKSGKIVFPFSLRLYLFWLLMCGTLPRPYLITSTRHFPKRFFQIVLLRIFSVVYQSTSGCLLLTLS
jgi:hypothetical protein